MLGLQLAKAAGLRAIITSLSDEKLARAHALGTDVTIHYTVAPEWHQEVLCHTNGEGMNVVLVERDLVHALLSVLNKRLAIYSC